MLGQFEEAYKDLAKACQIDYDDDANEMMKEVKERVSTFKTIQFLFVPVWYRGPVNH